MLTKDLDKKRLRFNEWSNCIILLVICAQKYALRGNECLQMVNYDNRMTKKAIGDV